MAKLPNPKMSQVHFNLIAATIREQKLTITPKTRLALSFAKELMATNPRFNYWKFVEAATGWSRFDLPRKLTML